MTIGDNGKSLYNRGADVRLLTVSDYEDLKRVMIASYPDLQDNYWKRGELELLVQRFPEGQFIILQKGQIIGCALSIMVFKDDFMKHHTYTTITDHFRFDTHEPLGNTLYGIDIFIHPDERGKGHGTQLYDARKKLCRDYGLKGIVFGGRIPGYHRHSDSLTVEKYIDRVVAQSLMDPVLTFQLRQGFQVVRVLDQYMPGDHSSNEYAVLMEWG